jgi:hypothetical protein
MITLCKVKEFLGLFLLLCLFYLAYLIYKHRSQTREIMESYESYDKNIDQQKADAIKLSEAQKAEVQNIFTNSVPKSISEYVGANKNLLRGPAGPMGPMGQSGGNFIETGYLVNKSGSYDGTNKIFSNPNRALTRASGNDPKASLAFLDGYSPFATYQKWTLSSNNNLVSQFDQSCVAFNPNAGDAQKVYMSTCNDNSAVKLQKDKYSRLMLTDTLGTPNPKCLTLGNKENQVLTTGLPDCASGNDCFKVGFGKSFLKVDNCDINIPKDNEIWTFL